MKIERRLGDSEKMFWLLDQAATINFFIVGRVEGELNPQAVRDALEGLMQMHPLLSTSLELRPDGPWLVTNDQLRPALTVMERENDEHWHGEIEKDMNAPFDCYTGPLWRVKLLHSPEVSELLFTFYHPISDGDSGVYALRDFLTLAANWKPNTPLVIDHTYPVRPPVEELLPVAARGWPRFSKTIALMLKQAACNFLDRPQKLSFTATPRSQRTTKIIPRRLPAETVNRLVAKCREQKTSVHGGLGAAILLAIANRMEVKGPLNLSLSSIVNLRKDLNPPLGDEIGLLASGVSTVHRLRPTPEFWSLAREVKRDVNKAVAATEAPITLTLVRYLTPKNVLPDAFAERLTKIFPYAAVLTNLGRLEIPEQYGALKLTQLHGAVSSKILAGQEFNLSSATFAGQMHLNFFYAAPNLAEETVQEIVNDTLAILEENL
jgi:hypothetical protein